MSRFKEVVCLLRAKPHISRFGSEIEFAFTFRVSVRARVRVKVRIRIRSIDFCLSDAFIVEPQIVNEDKRSLS